MRTTKPCQEYVGAQHGCVSGFAGWRIAQSLGARSTQQLRNEYCRDPALPILLGDDVLKTCLRKGLEEGLFVCKEGERLEGQGSPAGTLNISEDTQIFMTDMALDMGVWPPRKEGVESPVDPHPGGGGGASREQPEQGGSVGTVTQAFDGGGPSGREGGLTQPPMCSSGGTTSRRSSRSWWFR